MKPTSELCKYLQLTEVDHISVETGKFIHFILSICHSYFVFFSKVLSSGPDINLKISSTLLVGLIVLVSTGLYTKDQKPRSTKAGL